MTDLPRFDLTEDGITDALRALGNDPAVIAATLAAYGVKGVRDDETCCVAANWCRKVLRDRDDRYSLESVYAWQGGVWVEWSWREPNGLDTDRDHFDWKPSPAFAAFIERFDRGDYQELIEGVAA